MKRNILISWIITIILLAIFIFTGPIYSYAGDVSIAKYLASNAEPGFNSVSWGLGAFLKVFVKLFPTVNWWTMFSIFMMFSSLFFLTLFIQELFDGVRGILLAIVFALFLWETVLSIEINFTQTAILSGITGTSASLIIGNRKTIKGKICYGLISFFYIIISGAMRSNAMIMCIPFALVVLALRVVKRRQVSVNIISPFIVTPFTVIILSVLVSFGAHFVYRQINPDIAFFEDTFDLTREVYDYIDMYPPYEEVSDVYEAAGLKSSWYAMLTDYYIADTNYFNIETLSVPVQFKGKSTKTFSEYMIEMLQYKSALILGLIVLVLAGILTNIKKSILPIISSIAVFIVSGLYFVHIGRYAWRVSGGITVACVVMGLMMLTEFLTDQNAIGKSYIGYVITAICIVFVVIHINSTKTFSIPKSEVTDTAKANLLDYMDSNKNIIYFTEDFDYEAHNIWYVESPGYLDNKYTIYAGYNEGRKSDLEAAGINDMSAFVIHMLTRDDIYTVYSDTWSAYLCDYYNPYVSAGIVDVFEETGTQFIRFVAPIEATENSFDDTISDVSLYVDSSMQTDSYQVVHVSGKTSIQEKDVSYYLNIENASTGAIYSYPLVRDGDNLTGDALWKNDTWNFMDTSQYIVVKYPDGKIVRVLNITGAPVPYI